MADTPTTASDTPAVLPALSEREWQEQIAHKVAFARSTGHGEIASHVYVMLADVTDGGVEAVGDTEAVEIHWNSTERTAQLWDRHKLAALCLHGRPYGFTQEDVDTLREPHTNDCSHWALSDYCEAYCDCGGVGRLKAVALRIAALLPPPTP